MAAHEDWMEPLAGPETPSVSAIGPEAWADLPALRALGLDGGWLVSPADVDFKNKVQNKTFKKHPPRIIFF
jgi:hypothetical protein